MKIGTVLRTLRHVEPRQALAQLRHLLLHRGFAPRPWRGGTPRLRVPLAAAPFPGAPAHARCADFGASLDNERWIELIDRRLEIAEAIDWEYAGFGPLWAYHLHGFDFLRRPGLHPEIRAMWMVDWIARHPSGIGWDPHPCSIRILNWGKLLLTPGGVAREPALEDVMLESLASQIETLASNLEVRLQGNHLFTNLVAVVFGALLLDSEASARWLAHTPALLRELEKQVGKDGMHVECSPMYHALLLENLLDLCNLAQAVGDACPPGLLAAARGTAARMAGALAVVTHPDREIALLADSAFDIAQPADRLAEYAASLSLTPTAPEAAGALTDAGIVRLEAGPVCAIARLSGPSPPYQPGHAHCDALAFELSWHGERVVTDTGVHEYVPGVRRDRARATAAHATAMIDGQEQAECWSAHRVGGRPRVEILEITPNASAEARCQSWANPGVWHRRRFVVSARELAIHERIEGEARSVVFHIPFAPGVEVEHEGRSLHLRLASGASLLLTAPDGLSLRLERVPYYPRFGSEQERLCLVAEGQGFRDGVFTFTEGA